jgi:multidrug efflux pump subunit AcrB
LSGLILKRPNSSTAKINKTEFKVESPIVTRVDNTKVVELKAGFDSNDTSTLVNIAKAEVEKYLDNPDNRFGLDKSDFKFDFGSESSNQESFKGVIYALPILLIAMYILLAIQFKGLIQPLLIFMAVPFSLPGVAIGLTLTSNPISFFAVVGFFALIGISVNNTIMLVDFANQKRREGFGPREAMAKAIEARIRPLLVTSITAVVALLPLVLTDPFWESLAVTLMFGLISSTILVTTIFPYYYLAIEKLRSKKYN